MALGGVALPVDIGEVEVEAVLDGGANLAERFAEFGETMKSGAKMGGSADCWRMGSGRTASRRVRAEAAALARPASAQVWTSRAPTRRAITSSSVNIRGREVKLWAQAVADAGFAVDGDAGEDEVLDIAIDGAERDFKVQRKLGGGDGASLAQQVDELEQAVCTAH